MKTQELFEFEGSDEGILYVLLKITDEFTNQDASEIVNDFAMRQGGEVEDEFTDWPSFPEEGEFHIKFETIEEAEQAKKYFRRLSRMRPGFKILEYEVYREEDHRYGDILSDD